MHRTFDGSSYLSEREPMQSGRPLRSEPVTQQQRTPKKPPTSQKPADYEGISDVLEDLSFLRLPEVKAITGLSKTSIYELIRSSAFPAPIRLGPRAVAWVRSEIRQWAVERVNASRSAA
jgi:predicted DNA-binding transcriptional regulator AlpA